MSITDLFKIKKDERLAGGLFLLWQIILNALVIVRYFPSFSHPSSNYYKLFIKGFHISGFDPLTYCVVSNWYTSFDVHRHPLLQDRKPLSNTSVRNLPSYRAVTHE